MATIKPGSLVTSSLKTVEGNPTTLSKPCIPPSELYDSNAETNPLSATFMYCSWPFSLYINTLFSPASAISEDSIFSPVPIVLCSLANLCLVIFLALTCIIANVLPSIAS